ncbi:MAG: 4-alpha-glucanotransferase [Egibacteraceae bacterium]
MAASAELVELASQLGVARGYDGIQGWVETSDETLRAVLKALGIDASDPGAALAALRRDRPLVPPTIVLRQETLHAGAALSDSADRGLAFRLHLEDGSERSGETEERDGAVRVPLPADLPLGYHTLTVEGANPAHLIVAPERCPFPEELPPAWGWTVQLYALRSCTSWGLGDLADLRTLARTSGEELGADFVVCNPLHAPAPVLPLEPSPYYPSSRLFADPTYLRIEELRAYAVLGPAERARVDGLGEVRRARNTSDELERDAAFTAKFEALAVLHAADLRDRDRMAAFAIYRVERGERLEDFATFSALAERHGLPFQRWPAALGHPDAEGTAAAREELADRITFHAWLQWCVEKQLASVQADARAAGMAIGIVHDLAVGVDKGGADAWSLQSDLATGITVGAPPDAFNQQGQDWQQPPLLPNRLAATGYTAFREVLRATLRHAGGVRIDHILGAFRLFWIPEGASPKAGTYVEYDADAMLGVLALEAHRAGAIVIGEDLGTVAPGLREALRAHRILGCSVLYFEQDDSQPRPAEDYPVASLASVNTHDLPTAAGWWPGETLRVQRELGLLDDAEAEAERRAATRQAMRMRLRERGLIGDDPTIQELVEGVHRYLGGSSSCLLGVSIQDAIGDIRQPNLPGTIAAYPNWRLPVAEPTPDGPHPVLLEDLLQDHRLRRLATIVAESRTQAPHLEFS